MNTAAYALGLLRICLGWIFLWAFLDKLFGLGFSTAADKAWLAGGSPTSGFLMNGTSGPFAQFYAGLAGNGMVDVLFMLGLLGIGAALMLGIGVRIASAAGVVLMVLMYTAALFPANNPFIDDHVIYAILLVALSTSSAGNYLGLGKWWSKTKLVQAFPILK